jgi:hypothetical protein
VFESEELNEHLKTSPTIETESVIFAEWNLNDSDNIERIGNYRYRPGVVDSQFSTLPTTYDPLDLGGYYTGATEAQVGIETNLTDQEIPTLFTTKAEKMNLLYSLEDCIKQHRPRSGINKLLYLGNTANQYLDIGDKNPEEQEVLNIARRPRYYMSSRKDPFKYWTSYRTEVVDGAQEEFGVSRNPENDISYIYDACPFIVYRDEFAVNRIVVKMQTNVGELDLGPFRVGNQEIPDPLYGYQNQTTPQRWAIQVLKDDSWVTVIDFDENSVDAEGEPIIKSDGYVEIGYGLDVPEFYKRFMVFAGELNDASLLPEQAPFGYTYLIRSSQNDRGTLKFNDGGSWIDLVPDYRWFIAETTPGIQSPAVTKLTDPDYFIDDAGEVQYREIDFIRGIRLAVKTMNVPECTFDLIEISPRILADVSEKVSSFTITKTLSDLGNGSVPVGNVLASTGNLDLMDDDFSFNPNNAFNPETKRGSVISKYTDRRTKFLFYQIVRNVNNFDYFIPIKTMYVDEIPAVSGSTGIVSLSLRDLFFLLESEKAPEILITDVSVSYAVTLLLDYMGFSNYVFRRQEDESETVIPFFFVSPDQNVAEILQQLAVATQTAMFFDEYNNFVVISKKYLLPEEGEKKSDSTLYGQDVLVNDLGEEYPFLGDIASLQEISENKKNGAYKNINNNNVYVWSDTSSSWVVRGNFVKIIQPNIINLSSEEKRIYNEGNISYTARYIQRAISKQSQAPYIDRFKTYGYKPSLLWEVSGRDQLRSQNEAIQSQQGFTLSAVPLNTSISEEIPTVVGGIIINNIIDLGEGVDAVTSSVGSYQGYFYANGEVIQYDAMEYAIVGPLAEQDGSKVWITSPQEYQRYFSRVSFNGKMYPTGLLRIFVEPEYETDENGRRFKDGPVKRHGRGQFGTPIVSHDAGLNSYWSDNNNVGGCLQQTQDYLFNTSEIINYPDLSKNIAGKTDTTIPGLSFFSSDLRAQDSTRTGIIKNFRANKYMTEQEKNYFETNRVGTLQSSALVFNGPELPQQVNPVNFVSYVYKDLPGPYRHFGTRMRIIGKINSQNQKSQTPSGSFPIYNTQDIFLDNPEKNIEIAGGSGGIAFNLNKETNNGYYFEIVSLTQDNVSKYQGSNKTKRTEEKIIATPSPNATDNVVTVNLEKTTSFQVGQRVIIAGLSDKNAPQNISTPLNGEYRIDAINIDKKSFQYKIPTPSVTNLTITTAEADGETIKYNVVSGDTRQTFIKAGDKINISGTNNSDFNLSNVYVKSFRQLKDGWYFTVSAQVTGSATGGSVTYVPLTTTSSSGGTASYSEKGNNSISNIFFYKILADKDGKAIPYKLWSGLGNILVDDGKFTGQYRLVGEQNPTVYDLAVEHVSVGSARTFYLFINGKQIATVADPDPLPEYSNMALFVRGTSHCMFENIYALGANIAQNSTVSVAEPISKFNSFWGDNEIDANEALRKYALSGIIQKTYLSGISTEENPSHILYFDEFGTIMREVAYLNIRYDRAFPALYARVMKTFNKIKGYAISGFYAGSYGADFLVFNCLDTNINLDDTTGNFLRIQGITFTQNTTRVITVNDFYKKLSNFSNPVNNFDGTLIDPAIKREEYSRILNSRSKYGTNEFTIETQYLQTDEAAEDVFGWILDKVTKPKVLVGMNTFGNFNLQLGDIVNINYVNNDGLDVISPPQKQFVIYSMEYTKNAEEQNIITYLAEV